MTKKKEHWSASPDEFRITVETELKFLRDQYGYNLLWSTDNPFEAIYINKAIKITVTGISYGFGAMVSIIFNGEEIPFWTLTSKMNKRFTPSTNKPQLDELREYAYRLQNECHDILAGNFTRVDAARKLLEENQKVLEAKKHMDTKGMFFSKADKLWKNKDFEELNILLAGSPYRLAEIWQKRFEYSKKNV